MPAARPVTVRRPPVLVVLVAVSALVLAWSTSVASGGVPAVEERVFRWLHRLPGVLEVAVWLPMQVGVGWMPLLVAAVAWLALRQWRPVAGVVAAGLAGWYLARAVKDAVGRGRPAAELADVALRWSAPHTGLGFVSGHTTVAFAMVAVLWLYVPPRWRWVPWVWAAAVGFARIHLGAHLPLDVLGGAALGIALGSAWNLAAGVSRPVGSRAGATDGATATTP